MRYNLVTRFVCAKCGSGLAISYGAPYSNEYCPEKGDGITGAAKVEQFIAIHPCTKFYGDAIRPIEALRAALNADIAASTTKGDAK